MPKVKALCNLGAGLPPLKEGEVAVISDMELATLRAMKRCPVVVIEEPKPEPVAAKAPEPIKAEPVKPAATSKQLKS